MNTVGALIQVFIASMSDMLQPLHGTSEMGAMKTSVRDYTLGPHSANKSATTQQLQRLMESQNVASLTRGSHWKSTILSALLGSSNTSMGMPTPPTLSFREKSCNTGDTHTQMLCTRDELPQLSPGSLAAPAGHP